MSVHDRWRGARTGTGKRWEARWREGSTQRKRRFDSKVAAEFFNSKLRLEPEVRTASAGKQLTVEQMMATWYATKSGLRPKTLDAYRMDLTEVTRTFGDRLASTVRPSEVRVWTGRDRGVSLRRRSFTALAQAYQVAVQDGLLVSSPCVGIRMPKAAVTEPRFLTFAELGRLSEAAGDHAPMIWLLGTCGLRLGEAIGLQVGDVNVARSRVRVARSVVTTSGGAVVGPPKSGKGRDVPVPEFVVELLPLRGRGVGEWLFPAPMGGHLDQGNWRRKVFGPAARAAGFDGLHPHALRHTAASLAIEMGADVLMVQRMLGHASPSITLVVYSHLWDSNLNSVSEKMNERFQSGLD